MHAGPQVTRTVKGLHAARHGGPRSLLEVCIDLLPLYNHLGRLKVKCYYAYNTTNSLSFIAARANNEPYAAPAGGGLEVVMRMASGRFLLDAWGSPPFILMRVDEQTAVKSLNQKQIFLISYCILV